MLTDDEILDRFRDVNCWESGGRRAPHKPLLILLGLAALQRDQQRWLSYESVEPKLTEVLRSFGRPKSSVRPYYPYWRLRNDNLWLVTADSDLSARQNSSGDVSPVDLRNFHARAGFSPEVFEALRARPDLVNKVAAEILDRAFETSYHEPILDAIGFPWVVAVKRPRDPKFRDHILRIYERRCAMCGFDGRLGATNLALDAAHIMWHSAGGPDISENGIALCSFHHVLFDRGAIGLTPDHRIQISSDLNGGSEVDGIIDSLAGKALRPPQKGNPVPAKKFIEWHQREVFWEPARIG